MPHLVRTNQYTFSLRRWVENRETQKSVFPVPGTKIENYRRQESLG